MKAHSTMPAYHELGLDDIDEVGSIEEAARSERLANIISLMFLPPLLAIVTFVALSAYTITDPAQAVRIALVSSLFIAVAPAAYIAYLLKSQRLAGGVDLAYREERLRPYLASVTSSFAGLVVLVWLSAPAVISVLALCYAINSAAMALITQRWKISAHAAGTTMPLTALVSVFGAAALPLAVFVPVVCWARVRLQMHTVTQVCAGALLGAGLTWLQITLFWSRF